MKNILLTKSKYLTGLQCSKYIWTVMNDPYSIPQYDAGTLYRFEEGYLIDEMAKSLYTNGITLQTDNFLKNIEDTKNAFKKRKPLFEAGIMADNLYGRADILSPIGIDKWDLLETKSSIEVKPIHIQDVAFQKYCYQQAGIKINKCFLLYVNNEYIREGKLKPEKLIKATDISVEVEEEIIEVPSNIKSIFTIINTKKCPKVDIGEYCTSPYECPLIDVCWHFLPEKDKIFSLNRGGKKSWSLYKEGILTVPNIPDDIKLSDKQKIQRKCVKSGKSYIDKQGIMDFFDKLIYPLHFLDFETFATVVPKFDKTKPYQNIPFQFSLHIIDSLHQTPRHYSFLYSGKDDPRKDFLINLKKGIRKKGSILVYNQSFEKKVLELLGFAFPDYKDWIVSVLERIIDLYEPFRDFSYYHPSQQGSASLKKVLPALTGKSYKDMEISDGMTASLLYYQMTYGEGVDPVEENEIRQNLEEYCGLDTEGMIWILRELDKLI